MISLSEIHFSRVCSCLSFLGSSDLTCRFEDAEISRLLLALCHLIVRRPNLGLAPCRALKCVSTAISGGVDIPEVPRCHLLHQT